MSIQARCARLLLFFAIIAALLLPVGSASAAAQPQQVLLIYDSLAHGTAREGNVAELQRLLAAYSARVTLISLDEYEAGMMSAYASVITLINAPDLKVDHAGYLQDEKHYGGRVLHIGYSPPDRLRQALHLTEGPVYSGSAKLHTGSFPGLDLKVQDMPYIAENKAPRSYGSLRLQEGSLEVPFAIGNDNYTYAPYLAAGNPSVLAMADVLQNWLHTAETETPQTYLVLKEIYPFSDLDLLEETAERLYSLGIPFIASVRPVFGNTDYPAMQRYLAALRQVQSRGGSIMVNAPVVTTTIVGSDHTLGKKMSGFINLLADNGIAPLGIGAEAYWAYDREYSESGMSFFDSGVLFPDEEVLYTERSRNSAVFASSLYSLPLDTWKKLYIPLKEIPQLPVDTALTADLPQTQQELENMLEDLSQYWTVFADYKQRNHRTVTGEHTVVSSGGILSVDGNQLNLDDQPSTVSSDYQYAEEPAKSFTRLFKVQNTFFVVVILISLLLFGGLLVAGYRLYRRKYLK